MLLQLVAGSFKVAGIPKDTVRLRFWEECAKLIGFPTHWPLERYQKDSTFFTIAITLAAATQIICGLEPIRAIRTTRSVKDDIADLQAEIPVFQDSTLKDSPEAKGMAAKQNRTDALVVKETAERN